MRVLLVDDHAIVRAGFTRLLEDAFEAIEIGQAANAVDALSLVTEAAWDVVVLDLSLPGRGGLDVLKDMRAVRPSVAVLVMTMYAEEQYASRAFRAGAAGFITKDSPPESLIEAVRKVMSGGKYVTPALAEKLAANLGTDHAPSLHDGLSNRELQVLRMFAAGKTVKEVGAELDLSAKTISTYRTRILDKMGLRTTAQLVRYAIASGLVE